jgi:hypothetical protein
VVELSCAWSVLKSFGGTGVRSVRGCVLEIVRVAGEKPWEKERVQKRMGRRRIITKGRGFGRRIVVTVVGVVWRVL